MAEAALAEGISSKLLGEGLTAGVALLVLLVAIVYLQRKRDSDNADRIKEARESLVSIVEFNTLLKSIKEAMAALSSSDAGLSTSVMTSVAEIKSLLMTITSRQERIEKEVEQTNERIQTLDGALRDLRGAVDRASAGRGGAPL